VVGEQELDGNYYYQWTRDSHEDVFSSIPIPDKWPKTHPKSCHFSNLQSVYKCLQGHCSEGVQLPGIFFSGIWQPTLRCQRRIVRQSLRLILSWWKTLAKSASCSKIALWHYQRRYFIVISMTLKSVWLAEVKSEGKLIFSWVLKGLQCRMHLPSE